MSTITIKTGEALSHGHIYNKEAKREESETIQQQIDAFFASGGVRSTPDNNNKRSR